MKDLTQTAAELRGLLEKDRGECARCGRIYTKYPANRARQKVCSKSCAIRIAKEAAVAKISRPLGHRFMEKFARNDAGCWIWTAAKNADGYGVIRSGNRMLRAPRVAYELFVGPIPNGLTIDHLCRRPACVNPEHLEAVTMKENVHRNSSPWGRESRQTHCLRGHPFDEKNTLMYRGTRQCRACNTLRARERKRRRTDALSRDRSGR